MVAVEFLAGAFLLVASLVGLWVALPKDGQVRPFLRNDHVQAYYVIALLGAFVFGILNLGLAWPTCSSSPPRTLDIAEASRD